MVAPDRDERSLVEIHHEQVEKAKRDEVELQKALECVASSSRFCILVLLLVVVLRLGPPLVSPLSFAVEILDGRCRTCCSVYADCCCVRWVVFYTMTTLHHCVRAQRYRAYLEQERSKWSVYREKRRARKEEKRKEQRRKKEKHRKKKKNKKKKKKKSSSSSNNKKKRSRGSDSGSDSSSSSSSSSSSESSSLESEDDFQLFLKKKEQLKKKVIQKHIELASEEMVRKRKLREAAELEQHKKLQRLHEQREARMAVHNQVVEEKKKGQAQVTAELRRQREKDREAIHTAQQLVTDKDGPWPRLELPLPLRVFCCLPGLAWAAMDMQTGELRAKKTIDGKELAAIDDW